MPDGADAVDRHGLISPGHLDEDPAEQTSGGPHAGTSVVSAGDVSRDGGAAGSPWQEVAADLAALDRVPPEHHAAVYERVHQELQRQLAAAGSDGDSETDRR